MAVSASRTLSLQTKNSVGKLCSRQCFAATDLSLSGTSVRVKIAAHSSIALKITSVTIGTQDSSGAFTSTPTRLYFGGNNGTTVAAGVDQYTDYAAFVLDETKGHLVHISLCDEATNSFRYKSGGTEYVKYTTSDECLTVSGSGYASGAYQCFVSAIEVESGVAAVSGLFFCHG